MKEALLKGEKIYLPFGTIYTIPETRKKQRRIGLNGPEWCYKQKRLIKFEPKDL